MKTLSDINILTFFSARELTFVPKHFIRSRLLPTTENIIWIEEMLSGRFAYNNGYIYFENPEELLFYELKWG